MKRVKSVVTLLVVLVLIFGFGSMASAKTIEWKMATTWPSGTLLQWTPDYLARIIGEMSGGRLEIKVYPAGKLIGALEVFDATRMGSIDCAHATPAYWVGKSKAAEFFRSTVCGLGTIERMAWMYEDEGMDLYHEMYKPFGFGAAFPAGMLWPEGLAWSNKQIKSMDDFKGLKFRTSGYWGELLKEAGAAVVMLPGGEVYEGLQRKVIDAAEYATPGIDKNLAFYEICKYMLVPGIHQPSSMMDLIINKKSWEKLPDDLKAIVKYACKVATFREITKGLVEDAEALAYFDEKGVEIQYLNPDIQKELKKRAYAIMEKKAAEDPLVKKIWESQVNFQKKIEPHKKMMTPKYD